MPLLIVILLLLALAAFLPGLSALWTSDDYGLVGGLYGNPPPSFWGDLGRSYAGFLTPHRLFNHTLIGFGEVIGPAMAHTLGLTLHLACALFWGVLTWSLFRSHMLTFLACGLFVLAPWVTEPVLWWTGLSTTAATACMLLSANLYLASLSARSATRPWFVLLSSFALFMSLCWYDLWLAGFLLFFGIALIFPKPLTDWKSADLWYRLAIRLAPIAFTFAFWFALVLLLGLRAPQYATPSTFSWARVPIVLASIHLRVANWLVGPDWLGLWKIGVDALTKPVDALVAILGLGSLALMLVQMAINPRGGALTDASASRPPGAMLEKLPSPVFSTAQFPWPALLLAWMMFLASRLVFLLQAGMDLHTRHSYGAGLAVALAAAALGTWSWYRWCEPYATRRWLAVIAIALVLMLMTLTTAGRARQISLSSQAEAYTIHEINQVLIEHPEVHSLTVVGTPVPDIGELNYFAEYDGMWLNAVLHDLGHRQEVRVIRVLDAHPAQTGADVYFYWSGQWPDARLAQGAHQPSSGN